MRTALLGFTLLEGLIVIALMSIVLSFAVPSLVDARNSQQVDSVQRSLLSAMNTARAQAVNQSQRISLCGSSDGTHCDGIWSQWLVFQGPVPASNVAVTAIAQGSGQGLTLVASNTGATWLPTGAATDAFTLSLCPSDAAQARQVNVSLIGRARGSLDMNGDGQHEIPIGTCP